MCHNFVGKTALELIEHRTAEHGIMERSVGKSVTQPVSLPSQPSYPVTLPSSCEEVSEEKVEVDCNGRVIAPKKKKKHSSTDNVRQMRSVKPSRMQTVTFMPCTCNYSSMKDRPLEMTGGRSFAAMRNDLVDFFSKVLDNPVVVTRQERDRIELAKVVLELCTVCVML